MDTPRYPLWPFPESPDDEGRLWLKWLVRLRWVAIIAQVLTVTVALRILDGPQVVLALLSLDAVLIAANLRALRRLARDGTVSQRALVSQLGLDVAALTAFFVLAGGVANPFTILYLIHVAMGAVMLRRWYAVGLTGFVLACYGLLHLGSMPLHLDRHSLDAGTLQVLGNTLSFSITAVAVVGFVLGVASTLRWRSRQLLEARDRTARTDRLRSVGTLAAGAAHELNTPLSTMGLRIRRVARRHADDETTRDLHVVREQLDRCGLIVRQLLVGAGDPAASQIERRPLGELVREAVGMWSHGNPGDVRLQDGSVGLEVEVPRIAFTQALVNLLENAREAQVEAGCHEPIEVEVRRAGPAGVVTIRDRGCGLPSDADRVGDPFFTTKPTGTGLGVYVARAVADGSGGGLRYQKGHDFATEAIWWFPEAGAGPAVAGFLGEVS